VRKSEKERERDRESVEREQEREMKRETERERVAQRIVVATDIVAAKKVRLTTKPPISRTIRRKGKCRTSIGISSDRKKCEMLEKVNE
jgi:hypothetical protein